MLIKTIRYTYKRQTKPYESEEAMIEATLDPEESDNPDEVYDNLKTWVWEKLGLEVREKEIKEVEDELADGNF